MARMCEGFPDLDKYLGDRKRKYVNYIHENGMVKSYQVLALRKYLEEEHVVTYQILARLMNDSIPGKVPTRKVSFSEKKLRTFFSANYTVGDMEKIIIKLLTQWKAEQEGDSNGV